MLNNKKTQEYNMIREIREQGAILNKLLDKYVDCGKKNINFTELNSQIDNLKKIKHVVFIACGTSYYAGIYGKYVFEEFANMEASAEYADEFNSRKVVFTKNTLVVAMSQSGETSDVITAVEKAKGNSAMVLAITNGVDSKLSKVSDLVIYNDAGEEKALAATKSYTSQLLLLNLLAISFAEMNEKLTSEFTDVYFNDLQSIVAKIEKVLDLEQSVSEIAKGYVDYSSLMVLGRKYNYITALEAAHKLKETTYVHAEGAASEEFIHGPNAIIDKDFPTIFLLPLDSTYEDSFEVYRKINEEGADNILLTSNKDLLENKNTIILPDVSEYFNPIIYIIPLQIFAYYLALNKGINVDILRNITKFISK